MLPHRNFTPGSYLSNHQQLRRTTVCVVVVSNLWLFGDIVFRSLFRSLSPAAKIPFQTRNGQADRKSADDASPFPREVASWERNQTNLRLFTHSRTRF